MPDGQDNALDWVDPGFEFADRADANLVTDETG